MSRHNHLLAYRQIPTFKDYYKYTFFPRTIVHWDALPFNIMSYLLWHNSIMQQGISEPVFYGDLVYKFKRIVGKPNFSDQFKNII